MNDRTYTISDAECIVETDKAIKFVAPDFKGPKWIPKSQIDDDSEVYELGGEGDLIVTRFLASERGWV